MVLSKIAAAALVLSAIAVGSMSAEAAPTRSSDTTTNNNGLPRRLRATASTTEANRKLNLYDDYGSHHTSPLEDNVLSGAIGQQYKQRRQSNVEMENIRHQNDAGQSDMAPSWRGIGLNLDDDENNGSSGGEVPSMAPNTNANPVPTREDPAAGETPSFSAPPGGFLQPSAVDVPPSGFVQPTITTPPGGFVQPSAVDVPPSGFVAPTAPAEEAQPPPPTGDPSAIGRDSGRSILAISLYGAGALVVLVIGLACWRRRCNKKAAAAAAATAPAATES